MTGQLYIGLMSGTSMDAVDTALTRITEQGIEVVAYEQFPIEANLKQAVRNLDTKSNLNDASHFDAVLGHLFSDAVNTLLQQNNISASEIAAIGSHGQTVLHLPDAEYPRTLQIGDPNIIAHRTGITTIADFRRRDMAAGGQGAPLAPAFHNNCFRKEGVHRLALNLGGIANFTVLPASLAESITGFDTGPGNGLLDDWNREHNGTDMDRDSEWAATGNTNSALLNSMLADPFFELTPPKSTGRDYFNMAWLTQKLSEHSETPSPEDVQATPLSLTTTTVANAVKQYASQTQEIYVCGGGAHNWRLVENLQQLLPGVLIASTELLGIDPDAVEAACFAWLASRTLKHLPGNDPAVTGAEIEAVLGGIYPAG